MKRILQSALVGLLLAPLTAQAASFDISWTGRSSYTMTGVFTFEDALLGTGLIDETDIDSLEITVFLGDAPQGTARLGVEPFNNFDFNFDTTTETFVGLQNWNANQGPVGYVRGSGGNQVTIDTASIGASATSNVLLFATATPVPLPASAVLLAGALGVIGLLRRRRRHA